jgi:hypothetical protein
VRLSGIGAVGKILHIRMAEDHRRLAGPVPGETDLVAVGATSLQVPKLCDPPNCA